MKFELPGGTRVDCDEEVGLKAGGKLVTPEPPAPAPKRRGRPPKPKEA